MSFYSVGNITVPVMPKLPRKQNVTILFLQSAEISPPHPPPPRLHTVENIVLDPGIWISVEVNKKINDTSTTSTWIRITIKKKSEE